MKPFGKKPRVVCVCVCVARAHLKALALRNVCETADLTDAILSGADLKRRLGFLQRSTYVQYLLKYLSNYVGKHFDYTSR